MQVEVQLARFEAKSSKLNFKNIVEQTFFKVCSLKNMMRDPCSMKCGLQYSKQMLCIWLLQIVALAAAVFACNMLMINFKFCSNCAELPDCSDGRRQVKMVHRMKRWRSGRLQLAAKEGSLLSAESLFWPKETVKNCFVCV